MVCILVENNESDRLKKILQQALSENDLGSRGVFKGRGWRVGLAIKIRGGIFPAK